MLNEALDLEQFSSLKISFMMPKVSSKFGIPLYNHESSPKLMSKQENS